MLRQHQRARCGLIQQRRETRDPNAEDIVSKAIGWTIDGELINDLELLNCLLLLFMAGLDTVSNQLSYAMHHLATHPADRARITCRPTSRAWGRNSVSGSRGLAGPATRS